MSARRGLAALVVAAVVSIAVALPAVAFAAAPTAGGPVDVQVWPQDGQTIVISSVELPATTKLPAIVRIPVIPGSKVEWAGEIVGADASSDLPRDYKLVDGVGGQYAEFYLTTSRRGQLDSVASSLTVSGTTVSTTVNWIQTVASDETLFSVRLPGGISQVKISPAPQGSPTTNDAGEALYVLPAATLKAGAPTVISLSYSTVPEPVADPAKSSANTLVLVLGGVLVLAVVALILVVRRRAS